MEIFISIFLFSSLIIIILVLYYQREEYISSENDENSLSEWDCPDCGFHVQMGVSCTYCYTQKPN